MCFGHDCSKTETRGQYQGHSDPDTVCDTRRHETVSTNQILDNYLKQY